MTSLPPAKGCSRCGVEKPLEDFYRDARQRDGRQSYCKLCDKAYAKKRLKKAPVWEKLPDEVWKPVVGYEGLYRVSNRGRVCSEADSGLYIGEYLFSPSANSDGYLQVTLYKDRQGKRYKVHALVAEAFIGPKPDGHVVNHKSGNKRENVPENLEYVTQCQNVRHAVEMRLAVLRPGGKDKALTEKEVLEIRALRGEMSQSAIAKLYGVCQQTVSHLHNRKTWTHI